MDIIPTKVKIYNDLVINNLREVITRLQNENWLFEILILIINDEYM